MYNLDEVFLLFLWQSSVDVQIVLLKLFLGDGDSVFIVAFISNYYYY